MRKLKRLWERIDDPFDRGVVMGFIYGIGAGVISTLFAVAAAVLAGRFLR